MAVIPSNPSEWLTLLRQQITEIFHHLSVLERRQATGDHDLSPLMDTFETAENFVVEIDLPGFDRSDVSASISGSTLLVEAVKREDQRGENINYICLERYFGRFCRTLDIPPGIDTAHATALYRNGVLEVTFPRFKETAITRQILIG